MGGLYGFCFVFSLFFFCLFVCLLCFFKNISFVIVLVKDLVRFARERDRERERERERERKREK